MVNLHKGDMLIEKKIRSVNFGAIAKKIHNISGSIVQKVYDDFDPTSIEVSDEYKAILDSVSEKGNVVFVTGKAGTGKSTLINYLQYIMEKCIVVAPTSIAAHNVKGSTLHSFFGFPIHAFNPEDIKAPNHIMPLVRDLDLIIIDEVSMVNAAMVDAINNILREIKANDLPFGGISILFVGDLFQLPPILTDAEESKYFNGKYNSPFFYSAKILEEVEVIPYELDKVYRQQGDEEFISVLNAIRIGSSDISTKLQVLNQIAYTDKIGSASNTAITLAPRRALVLSINEGALAKINNETKIYTAKMNNLTKKQTTGFQAPDELTLKVGARVVFLKNNDPHYRNGSLGSVVELLDDKIRVRIDETGVIMDIFQDTWKKYKFDYDSIEKRIDLTTIGEYIQYPLALGWAITVHKSQGMTLDDVNVNLTGGSFAEGQTYVALSRVKSLSGLRLDCELSNDDIKVNQNILEFYKAAFGY